MCNFRQLGAYVTLFVAAILFIPTVSADIKLPDPQTKDGIGLFDALKKRASTSGGAFSIDPVSDSDLSTVLWSASGLNRGNSGWTVPMVGGKSPYVKIYVAGKDGVSLYDWRSHSLITISQDDIRADIGLQSFTRRAFYSLILVADGEAFATFSDANMAAEFSQVAVGAMTQNIYLAAAALNLSTRYIHSIKHDTIIDELQLSAKDKPIALMLLGKSF